MANAKVLRKAQLLRLLVNELCDNIEAREASESCLHTYGSVRNLKDRRSDLYEVRVKR